MDFLKVLSRGTNVGKGVSGNATTTKTPSSGAKPNPQLFGQDTAHDPNRSSTASDPQPAAEKRQRGQHTVGITAIGLPPDLDFFSGGSDEVTGSQPTATAAGLQLGVVSGALETHSGMDPAEGDGLVDVEECKRILRSHKVKITLLEDHKAQELEHNAPMRRSKKRMKPEQQETPRKKSKTQLFPQPLTSFDQLRSRFNISRRLADNIDAQGYTVPTEVQLASLPLLLHAAGADSYGPDLLSVAPTGSGKTLAFLIPIVESLMCHRRNAQSKRERNAGTQAVIIAPTKELAGQIVNECRKLCLKTGVRVSLMRKGMKVLAVTGECKHRPNIIETSSGQEDDSESGTDSDLGNDRGNVKASELDEPKLVKSDILVATPLTLLHALQDADGNTPPIPSVRYLVLDEADVLLDSLFCQQTLAIWNAFTNPLLRVSLWSATMASSIEEMAKSTINARWTSIATANIVRPDLVRLIVGLKDSAVPNIHHQLTYAATEQGKLLAIRQLLHPTGPKADTTATPALRPPFLVFTQTVPRAQALYSELKYDIPAEAGGSSRIAVLHSSLSPVARDGVMARFRRGEVWVLITTDVLARGVDFRGLNGVVNYDVPTSPAAYVHRVGRTSRAGRDGGLAVTLYTEEDVSHLRNVVNVVTAQHAAGAQSSHHRWLLDTLPTPSKRERSLLKKRGVEARRTAVQLKQRKGKWRTQISTKSGYEKRLEHNRKAAMDSSRRPVKSQRQAQQPEQSEEEFEGFDE